MIFYNKPLDFILTLIGSLKNAIASKYLNNNVFTKVGLEHQIILYTVTVQLVNVKTGCGNYMF